MIFETQLGDIVTSSESINVYHDGEQTAYKQGESSYNQIVEGWIILTEGAHEMPAFGVSLNQETVAAREVGLWVEFVFDKQYSHSGMHFEKLLIKVEKKWQGFNIIRYNEQGGYCGRCFFLDLVGKNMSDFYDILMNL